MNTFKKVCSTIVIALILSLVLPTIFSFSNVQTVNAASIKLNVKSATLTEGETLQLKLLGTTKKPVWKTSNKKVATIDKYGLVEAQSEGTAKITATINRKIYTCSITVEADPYNSSGYEPDFSAYIVQGEDSKSYVLLLVVQNNGDEAITFNFDGYVLNTESEDTSSPVNLFDSEDKEYTLIDEVIVESGEEAYIWYRNEDYYSFWIDEDTWFGFDFTYDDVSYLGSVNTNGDLKYSEGSLYD
jgi:hypothetical protein